jgi:hypothetical protein
MILFVGSEIILVFILRILGDYDLVKNNDKNVFGNNFSQFWGIVFLMVVLYFITMVVKYYLMYFCLLNSNVVIH